jgi:hypothetical protein
MKETHVDNGGEEELDEDMIRLALLPECSQLRFPPPPSIPSTPRDMNASIIINSNSTTVISNNSYNTTATASLYIHPSTPSSSNSPKSSVPEWPVLQCENIFVLPGIPQFFEKKMKIITQHFLKKRQVKYTKKIILNVEERSIVRILDTLVESTKPGVKFGSYPFIDHPEFKTIITVESSDMAAVDRAVSRMLASLPESAVLRVERVETQSKLDFENSFHI